MTVTDAGRPMSRCDGLTRRFGDADRGRRPDASRSGGASCSAWSAPTAPARPPPCACSPACSARRDGDASVAASSVARDPERVKPRLAYMSQRFGLYADLTVQREPRLLRRPLPGAARASGRRGWSGCSILRPRRRSSDRLAGQLSGGMKQKLGLSCALIHQPEVLLLDEPTFGVDPVSRRELWLIVHEMVARGGDRVVSTAYMDEAERCDRRGAAAPGDACWRSTRRRRSRQRSTARCSRCAPTDRAREAREALARHPGVRAAALFGDRLHVTVADGPGDGDGRREALRAPESRSARRPVAPARGRVHRARRSRTCRSARERGMEPARCADAAAVAVRRPDPHASATSSPSTRSRFDVRPGEVFGFLGPNGAGKTTTIKMLAGLLRADVRASGTVAGLDIATRAARRSSVSIGYMSQLFSLYADLTVDENIALLRRPLRRPRRARGGAARLGARDGRPRRAAGAAHRRPAARLEAAAGARLRRAARAADPLPRRAHLGRGPVSRRAASGT